MTREELRDRILLSLNDATTRPVFWSAEEQNGVLTEALEIVAEEVRAWRRTLIVPKRPGTHWYDLGALAPDMMSPYRIWDAEHEVRLEPITMVRLDAYRQRWLTVQSDYPQYWYPVSWGRYGIWPGTAHGGGTFRIDYLAWPPPLLDDGDEPETPEADHDHYVLYGVYLGLLQQNEVARGLERFTQFVSQWTDAQARNEVRRLQSRNWRRDGQAGRHPVRYFERG